jgi:hypothetical protein
MARNGNAGGEPGAAQATISGKNKPALDTNPSVELQADNKTQYARAVVSNRVRFIGTLGFGRRRRWRAPFTAVIFALERRLIGGVPS